MVPAPRHRVRMALGGDTASTPLIKRDYRRTEWESPRAVFGGHREGRVSPPDETGNHSRESEQGPPERG